MNLRSTNDNHPGASRLKPTRQVLLEPTPPLCNTPVTARDAYAHPPSPSLQASRSNAVFEYRHRLLNPINILRGGEASSTGVATPSIPSPSDHTVRVEEHLAVSSAPGSGEQIAQDVRNDTHPTSVADANLLLFFSSNPRDLDVDMESGDSVANSRGEGGIRGRIEAEYYNGARLIVWGKTSTTAGEQSKGQAQRKTNKRKAPPSVLKRPTPEGVSRPAKRVRFDSDTSAESQQDDLKLTICLPSKARLEEMLGRQPIWISAPKKSSATPRRNNPDTTVPSAPIARRARKTVSRSTRNR